MIARFSIRCFDAGDSIGYASRGGGAAMEGKGAHSISTACRVFGIAPNPHHKRAQLVVLSDKGKPAFRSAMNLQAPWANDLAEWVSIKDLETVHRVILALRNKLEGDEGSDA